LVVEAAPRTAPKKASKDAPKTAPKDAQTPGIATFREADGTGGPHAIEKVSKAGNVLLFFKEKKTWEEARWACRNIGGDLARLDHYEDIDLIDSIYQIGHSSLSAHHFAAFYWIGGYLGGTGANMKDNYVWVTGEPISSKFQYWLSWEPDGDECLILFYPYESPRRNGDKNKNGLATKYCDYTGYALEGYVCEV